ncbi:MAG: hypothetical protein LBD82_05970, partial [Deltaproteobacteria bacterium]|nr:hypothetical protein [Deltaproteobacteria bacterium]
GLQIKEVSFIKSLTHTFRLAYIKGTNDDECPWPMDDLQYDGLEKGVAFIEVGFDSSYAVTDNFTAALELGYLKPRVRSELADGTIPKVIAGVPPAPGNIDAYNTNPIYNANIYLLYAF